MKYPVEQFILNELNEPIQEPVNAQSTTLRALTFRHLAARGLINEPRDTPPEEKVARYDLFKKVQASTQDTDFSVEEVTLMRRACLTAFNSLIAGQLAAILDQKA